MQRLVKAMIAVAALIAASWYGLYVVGGEQNISVAFGKPPEIVALTYPTGPMNGGAVSTTPISTNRSRRWHRVPKWRGLRLPLWKTES